MSGINNSGQVAGSGTNGAVTQAFVGSPSGSTVIPLPAGWTSASVYAINDSGQVAGGLNGGQRAFVGTVSGSTAIPLPTGGISSTGFAINASGQVAGIVSIGGPSGGDRAFIGTALGVSAILLAAGRLGAEGFAINASGQVAGSGYSALGLDDQPFLGTSSGIALIPAPNGWALAFGVALNDSGQVAGTGNLQITDYPQAFIGAASGSTAIPRPVGATYAKALWGSLNNSGVVVGISDAGGWVWSSASGTQLLNAMVPPGWNISNAISISNNGLILAQGSYNGGATQYVELVPTSLVPATPAPGSGVLAMLGLLAVFGWWASQRSNRAARRGPGDPD